MFLFEFIKNKLDYVYFMKFMKFWLIELFFFNVIQYDPLKLVSFGHKMWENLICVLSKSLRLNSTMNN